eukprot:2881550-Amphidinium_carterae.1
MASSQLCPQILCSRNDAVWRFPSHRAVMCSISLKCSQDQDVRAGVSLRIPQKLPINVKIKTRLAQMQDRDEGLADLQTALEDKNVDEALRIWSWRWERLTLVAAEAAGFATMPGMEGRGISDAYEDAQQVPSTNVNPQQAHRPIAIRQLRRSLNMTRTWLHQSTMDIPWHLSQQYNSQEGSILHRLHKLHGIDHAFISQLTVSDLEKKLKHSTQEHDKARVAKWRSDMLSVSAACRYIRGAPQQRPLAVTDVDGKQAVGVEAMDHCLTRYWQQVAHPRETSLTDISTYVHSCVDKWGQAEELRMEPFTAEALSRLCKKTRKNTAPGPGAWRAAELCQLPNKALEEMASIMNLIMKEGRTPDLWRVSWTSYIPKGKTTAVQSQRPITVTALTWRLFAKHIASCVGPGIEERLHPAQCGARKGHSSVTSSLMAKKFADMCARDKCAGYLVQLDLAKCFNCLATADGIYALQRMGCPSHVCALLAAHYQHSKTRNKLTPVWGGRAYSTVRGCPQGCPLSTLLANALLKILPPEERPEIACSMYLDDTVIMSRSKKDLIAAVNVVLSRLRKMGLEVNASKCTYVGFGRLSEGDRKDLQLEGFSIPLSLRTTMLGFDLHTDEVREASDPQQKRAAIALERLDRVAKVPGNMMYRQTLVNLMVSSLWRWAPLGQTPHAQMNNKLRARVTAVLQGPKVQRSQSFEILYGALLKGHLVDPAWTQLQSTLVLAWKLFHAHSEARVLLFEDSPPGSLLHDLDRMLSTVHMWREGSCIHGQDCSFDFMLMDTAAALAHASREHYRQHLFARLEERRPREFTGLHRGLNREWLHRYHSSLCDPLRTSVFRRFVTGAFLCKERQHRHSKGAVDPHCMVCEEIETVRHITAECRRHCYAYHRTYLGALSEQSADFLARCGLPLVTEDIKNAGYEAYAMFMSSVIAALLQRDIDNAYVVRRRPEESANWVAPVRRRLRGKQPPPHYMDQLSVIKGSSSSRLPKGMLLRRRLVGKQRRPAAFALQLDPALSAPRAYNSANNRFLAGICFNEQGIWTINGHAIKKEENEQGCSLVCTLCHRHKLWKWRHLWALSHCSGPRNRITRAKRAASWFCQPPHVKIDYDNQRLHCLVCQGSSAVKHLTRFMTRHTKCG